MVHEITHLSTPLTVGGMSLTQALLQRRSVRAYRRFGSLSLAHLGQLLWAAQGVTSDDGLRTAPSAGALYPLEIHIVAGVVEELVSGVYHYEPHQHRLIRLHTGDVRAALAVAALNQSWIQDAAAILVCSAIYDRTTDKYGHRGVRYVHMEAGHVAQNVLLQATAFELHSAIVGAFDDQAVHETLTTPADCAPLYLIPIGH